MTAADDRASMAKTRAWLAFIWLVVSWFYFPERSISEASLVFGGQLAYIYGCKRLEGIGGRERRPPAPPS
ncbi:MAG: hypothetical protein LBV70_07285 [Candidatus Adiutrix sp.]|nr:hypothetical protein [Candidatus Adiutrix sp.]